MKAPEEPIEILHMIVRMLTREGRVKFDINEKDDVLRISINTIVREYGRLLGSGGQTVRDLNTLAKAMIGDVVVTLDARADDSIKRSEDQPCHVDDLLMSFISCADDLDGSEVKPGSDGTEIKTDCQDDILVAAIDRTFYNIGRAQRGLFRINWIRP